MGFGLMTVIRKQQAESTWAEKREKSQRKMNTPKSEQRESPARSLQQTLENQAVWKFIRSGKLRSKLEVSSPGERSERKTDRIAEEVIDLSESDASEFADRRNPTAKSSQVSTAAESVLHSSSSGGPLHRTAHSLFELRLGADFGRIREHADGKTAELNRTPEKANRLSQRMMGIRAVQHVAKQGDAWRVYLKYYDGGGTR